MNILTNKSARPPHFYILTTLAGLTLFFLATAVYSLRQQIPAPVPTQIVPAKLTTSLPSPNPQSLRLEINQTGIAAITLSQIHANFLPITELNAQQVQLTHAGRPVPFYVQGQGESATLYFHAEAITETLAGPSVYTLRAGQGVAMTQQNASPTGPGNNYGRYQYHWEENDYLLPQMNSRDIWLGPLLLAPNNWHLALADINPTNQAAELIIRMWSGMKGMSTDPDHHVQITLNNNTLQSHYWDGVERQTFHIAIPAGLLLPGQNNQLTLTLPGDTDSIGDAIYLDWIRLQYIGRLVLPPQQFAFNSDASNIAIGNASSDMLVFNVTNPQAPVLLTSYTASNGQIVFAGQGANNQYVALTPQQAIRPTISLVPHWPLSLRTPERGADYIAIVAEKEGFMEALQPLLDYRQEKGLRVTAVSLNQVYDEFNDGQPNPNAIQAFLTYAADYWQDPPPQFVLFVGDATYDIQNRDNTTQQNLFPAYFVAADGGYAASDHWFSGLKSLAIGRFPAQTAVQLSTIVSKTIAYETNLLDAPLWSHRVLLVTDNEPEYTVAGTELNQTLSQHGYQVDQFSMGEEGSIHYNIISAINQGVGLIEYLGHGGDTYWGDETVFSAKDTALLANQERLPIFTTFTCHNGSFTDPNTQSLAESLLWQANGGIVAAIAPAGRGELENQLPAAQSFYEQMLDSNGRSLGQILNLTQQPLISTPTTNTLRTLNLLGDPALTIHHPPLNSK